MVRISFSLVCAACDARGPEVNLHSHVMPAFSRLFKAWEQARLDADCVGWNVHDSLCPICRIRPGEVEEGLTGCLPWE